MLYISANLIFIAWRSQRSKSTERCLVFFLPLFCYCVTTGNWLNGVFWRLKTWEDWRGSARRSLPTCHWSSPMTLRRSRPLTRTWQSHQFGQVQGKLSPASSSGHNDERRGAGRADARPIGGTTKEPTSVASFTCSCVSLAVDHLHHSNKWKAYKVNQVQSLQTLLLNFYGSYYGIRACTTCTCTCAAHGCGFENQIIMLMSRWAIK